MRKTKIKDFILKTISLIALFIVILGMGCVDCEHYIALFVVMLISEIWLCLFCYVNEDYFNRKLEKSGFFDDDYYDDYDEGYDDGYNNGYEDAFDDYYDD